MRGLDRGSGHVPAGGACTRCTSSGWTGYGRRKVSMPLQGPLNLRIRIPPDVVSPAVPPCPSTDEPDVGGDALNSNVALKDGVAKGCKVLRFPIQATNRAPVPGSLILPSSNVLCRLGSHVNVGLDGLSERCATDRGAGGPEAPRGGLLFHWLSIC